MDQVIVIAGPTGVGKTALSVKLAKELHGEIISGDSMQIYKEMSIGTAKVKPEETQGIPHYLVDELSFYDEYSVKAFQEKARAYMEDMKQRNILPIICGGTGLYIKSCIYDYEFKTQEQDKDYFAFLQERTTSQLNAMLKLVDPNACVNIHRNNRQRLIRALEIAHSGEKKSELEAAQKHEPLYDAFIIGLTMDRERLYERINQRVDRMMEEGLLEEITQLAKDETIWDLQSMQGIGYKEWKNYFLGNTSVEECVELIKKNSRNFAKRQYTWFKNQMNVHWIDIEQENWYEDLLQKLQQWLKER